MKIPVSCPVIGEEELHYVIDAVKTGWVGKGGYIEDFERGFSKYHNCRYGVATMNGTVALHLALTALGIKKGDEVLVPDLTFVATAEAVSYCGATPIPIDVNKEYWNIEPNEIEDKITDRTKAIIPVHLYGHPCDMDSIQKIARNYDLSIVEDCAEAHGAEYKGRKIGGFGDVGCFSFYGNKVITTGEGGMCITKSKELADRMVHYRGHCMTEPYYHTDVGFNYRMTNLQAAIGLAQLKKLDAFIEKKREIACTYNSLLKDTKVVLPVEMPWAKNIYWMYSILVEKRDLLMAWLKTRGVETRPFFTPIHTLPAYRRRWSYPVSGYLSKNGMNLPSGIGLNRNEIEYICRIIVKKCSKG